MKKKTLRLLAFAGALLFAMIILTSCGNPEAPDVPDTSDPGVPNGPNLADALGPRESIEDVYINLWEMGMAPTSDEEKKTILDTIYGADLTQFVRTEESLVMWGKFDICLLINGEVVILRFDTASDEAPTCAALIKGYERKMNEEGNFVIKKGSTTFFTGSKDILDAVALKELQNSILNDTADADNCAVITADGLEEPSVVSKSDTWRACNAIDNALNLKNTTEAFESIKYDLTASVGDRVYKVNLATGDCMREMNGETLYGTLDKNALSTVSWAWTRLWDD